MFLVETYVAPSKIAGLGAFFAKDYPALTPTWRFQPGFDLALTDAELAALPALAREHVKVYGWKSRISGRWILPMDNNRYVNHADVPNVIDATVLCDAETRSVTARDVKAGEEITNDYASFDAEGLTIDRPAPTRAS